MAFAALVLIALPSFQFLVLWIIGRDIRGIVLVGFAPLAIAFAGWIGARRHLPGLCWFSAIGLTLCVLLMMPTIGILPWLYVPGTAAMFLAAGLELSRRAQRAVP